MTVQQPSRTPSGHFGTAAAPARKFTPRHVCWPRREPVFSYVPRSRQRRQHARLNWLITFALSLRRQNCTLSRSTAAGEHQHRTRCQQPVSFVEHFLAARRTAAGYGIPLIYAGARLHECHGPFCNVLRNVLNLVPGDVVTACFKCTTRNQALQRSVAIGAYDAATMQMCLDYERIAALQQQLRTPPSCCSCFNRFHCAGACPDSCALINTDSFAGSFRCEVQKQLATSTIA